MSSTVGAFVLPAIYSVDLGLASGLEATEIVIPIFGGDMSDPGRILSVELDQLPTNGILRDYYTGVQLTEGSILSRRIHPGPQKLYSQPINISYIGNPHYFSLPKTRHNGSIISRATPDVFSYRIKTVDNSYSPISIQEISVRNRNHATNISFSYPDDRSYYDIIQLGPDSDTELKSVAEIHGFSITDSDYDSNLMRLSIETMGGLIDLNPAHVGLLIFNGLQYCREREWQCQGNGMDDTKIDAVGTAQNIKNALNGLLFRSTFSDYIDIVNVTIYDGVGGNCLSRDALDIYTSFMGCYERKVSFEVRVSPFPQKSGITNPGFVTDKYLPIEYIFILIVTLLVCCCLCICYKCCKKKEDKYLKAGFVAPAHIRSRPFPINLCSECHVYPVSYSFNRKKIKRTQVDRDRRRGGDLESQASLDDINVEIEGEDGVPVCNWIPCEKSKRDKPRR